MRDTETLVATFVDGRRARLSFTLDDAQEFAQRLRMIRHVRGEPQPRIYHKSCDVLITRVGDVKL